MPGEDGVGGPRARTPEFLPAVLRTDDEEEEQDVQERERADEAKAAGLYPYFIPIEDSEGVYTTLEREVRRLDRVAVTSLTVGVEADTLTREIEGEHTARLTVRLDPGFGPEVEEALQSCQPRKMMTNTGRFLHVQASPMSSARS